MEAQEPFEGPPLREAREPFGGRPLQEEQDDLDVDPKEDTDHSSEPDDDDDDKGSDPEDEDEEPGMFFQMINRSHSISDLLTQIETQRMNQKEPDYPPLKGNLYHLMFIGRFDIYKEPFNFLGFVSISSVQIIGPLAIMFWAIHQIKWDESTIMPVTYDFGSNDRGLSHFLKVLLSVAFLFCFALNGLSVVKSDHEMTIKLKLLIKYADRNNGQLAQQVHWHWMTLGTLINATLPITCSVCLFLLFIIAEQPKDVVFDSLGMTFMYTLDDIDGPLGLLSSADWDEEFMGRFYFKTVDPQIKTAGSKPNKALRVHKLKKYRNRFGSYTYMSAAGIMRLLAFVLPFAFFFTDGIEVWPQD